jgi:hypothetical protein
MVPSVATEKFPVTPLGIDPETLGLAAQCLNHYATPGKLVGVGGNTAHAAPNVFSPFQKYYITTRSTHNREVFGTGIKLCEPSSVRTVLTTAVWAKQWPDRADYSCVSQAVSGPCWLQLCEPSSGRTVLTTAVCCVREIKNQVIWIHLYHSKTANSSEQNIKIFSETVECCLMVSKGSNLSYTQNSCELCDSWSLWFFSSFLATEISNEEIFSNSE